MSYKKQTQPPLRIYEVGGGTGTLALNILVRAAAEYFTCTLLPSSTRWSIMYTLAQNIGVRAPAVVCSPSPFFTSSTLGLRLQMNKKIYCWANFDDSLVVMLSHVYASKELPHASFPMQDWLRQHQPELYASCRYTCIEISPSLAQRQQQRVAVGGGHGGFFTGGTL